MILSRKWQQTVLCVAAGATILINTPFAFAQDGEPPHDSGVITFDDLVVTAAGRPEPLSKIASTVQVIDAEEIREADSSSITELLQERASAFFSEWTPAQTSITMRGARSDGQGRDFRGQVLVLLNGRRAGTANLSKLSPNQLERIEIIRGPASVAYGNQAIGGVINLITRNGRTVEGGTASVEGGSFGYGQLKAEYGGALSDRLTGSIGASGMTSDDYDGGSGSSKQINTASERFSALATLNWDLGPDHWLDLTVRTAGVYDAGFRGSSWDHDNFDDRWNHSIELTYAGVLEDHGIDLNAQLYAFEDVDSFHWGSEAAGFDEDNNRRELTAYGLRLTPQFKLTESTGLLLGFESELSRLRNTRSRERLDGTPVAVTPFDNNEDNLLTAGYAELTQSLFDDRLTLRAGGRYTRNELKQKDTPNLNVSGETATFDGTTSSVGLAYALLSKLKLRVSYATGFRSPTGRELAGEYEPVLGGTIIRGNDDLDAEESEQFELGLTYAPGNLFLDVAVFDQRIEGRITTDTIDPGPPQIRQFFNADGDAEVQGIEVQAQFDAAPWLGLEDQRLTLGVDASYHFEFQADGIDRRDSGPHADKLQRFNEYKASLRLGYEQRETWGVRLIGVLHGPMYYDPESSSRLLPGAEPATNFVHKKDAFWVVNLRSHYHVTDRITVYGGINNLFDKNEHPIFIAIDEQPYITNPDTTNGGRGNSMRGRFFYAGLRVRF